VPDIANAKFDLLSRGWVEHYSGFPADLFFSEKSSDREPWKTVPHLHINYAISGDLQSLTYKNSAKTNTYLYRDSNPDDSAASGIGESKLKEEAKHVLALK